MIKYKNFKVWQKSHSLVLEVYKIAISFPKEEQFNLVSQIKRAAISIPTNIAEGSGRETQKELIRFLYISSGSAHELEYLITISAELNLISKEKSDVLLDEIDQIKKMLAVLITKIKESIN